MNDWILTSTTFINMRHVAHVNLHTKDGIIIALSLYFAPSGQILLREKSDVQAVMTWFDQSQKISATSDRKAEMADSTP